MALNKSELEVGITPTKCLVCGKPTITCYCRYHYLMKEAGYALNDLDPDKKWASKKDKTFFQKMALARANMR